MNKAAQSEPRAYVCYHTPGSPLYHRLSSRETPETYQRIADLPLVGGYVIMPFSITPDNPLVFIRADNEESLLLPNTSQRSTTTLAETDDLIRRKEYEPSFHAALRRVKSGRLKKIVLSRRLRVRRTGTTDAFLLFIRACQMRPTCFTALWHTPQTGTWIVATPEPLLEKVGNRWHTVALAGTQPANIGTSPVWDDKNREEQAVVARFISEKLVPFAQQTKISPTYTLRAGNVCHLCTDFSFQLADSRDLLRVIETLHPTPAVCGLPRSEAFTAILEDETTPRRYYAGFSGPLALHGETSLYVSLRCMQLAKGEAVLYAGGGIMPESQMETEWEETERKLQTMLNLLQCTVIPHRSTN